MKRVRHLVEYAFVRVVLFFVDLLPMAVCIGIAHASIAEILDWLEATGTRGD